MAKLARYCYLGLDKLINSGDIKQVYLSHMKDKIKKLMAKRELLNNRNAAKRRDLFFKQSSLRFYLSYDDEFVTRRMTR